MTTAETASSKDLVRRWKTKAKKLIDIIEVQHADCPYFCIKHKYSLRVSNLQRDSEADVLDVPQGLTPITVSTILLLVFMIHW